MLGGARFAAAGGVVVVTDLTSAELPALYVWLAWSVIWVPTSPAVASSFVKVLADDVFAAAVVERLVVVACGVVNTTLDVTIGVVGTLFPGTGVVCDAELAGGPPAVVVDGAINVVAV